MFDSYGDGCEWYETNLSYCGQFDTEFFIATEMCCSCGGGCLDTISEARDAQGYRCEYYQELPSECGDHDTTDFVAFDNCCACRMLEEEWASGYEPLEEEVPCSCMAINEADVDECETPVMSTTLCVEDDLCYWGPTENADCYGYNIDPDHCVDSNGNARDSGGDDCPWYDTWS